MGKSKLTLIVDGNWLLMSRLPIINSRYADNSTMMHEVKSLMIKSINVVLRTFPNIDNVIFVTDGGSWRKDIEVPQFIIDKKKGETAVYKGNREKSTDIDWDLVFNEFNNFTSELTAAGISAFQETGIEGDDWCWYWSQKLNKEGTNVIIWTKDRDITQLCNTDANGCFTVVWNKSNGVFLQERDDITSFLLNPYFHSNEALLNDIVNRSAGKNIVNPSKVQIDKIIRGDAGDNILPVLTRQSKNGTITYKVTEKQLPENVDIYTMEGLDKWLDELLHTKQWYGKANENITEVFEHFIYNRQMVVLNESSYPQYILDIFHTYDNWFNEHSLCVNIDKAEATILAQKTGVQAILDEI